jgi:hypothetical protein
MTATLFETKHITLEVELVTANPGHDDDVPSSRIGGRREPLYASQSNRFQIARGKIERNETPRRLTETAADPHECRVSSYARGFRAVET